MSFAYKQKIYNCPNCAAPIGKDDICPYCGTRLRWVPFIEQTIKTVYMNVREIVAETIVDYDSSRRIIQLSDPEYFKKMTERSLAEKFVEIIPKIWTIEEEPDRMLRATRYRASIYVGDKNSTLDI